MKLLYGNVFKIIKRQTAEQIGEQKIIKLWMNDYHFIPLTYEEWEYMGKPSVSDYLTIASVDHAIDVEEDITVF